MNTDIVNARTGLGAGIGALLGFVFAGGPLGAGIGAIVGGGIANTAVPHKKGVLTPKRKLIYQRAMESIKSPTDLRKLSAVFAGEGLHSEAALLSKRAQLRELPQATKQKRQEAFRKAMASDNAEIIGNVASRFAGEGAIDAAKALQDHAEAVRAAHAAGRSAKPQPMVILGVFADKLGKALMHFGPRSPQVITAAANLVRAQGKEANERLVHATIAAAAEAMGDRLQPAQAEETQEVAQEEATDAAAAVEEQAEVAQTETVAAVALPDTGAQEPTVVGPPAGAIEQPLVATSPAIGADVTAAAAAEEAAADEAALLEGIAGQPQRMRVG